MAASAIPRLGPWFYRFPCSVYSLSRSTRLHQRGYIIFACSHCYIASALRPSGTANSFLFLVRSSSWPIPTSGSRDLADFVQGRQFPRKLTAFPSVSMSGKRSFFASKKKATNPFDSDSDDGDKKQQRPAQASSVPPPAEQRVSLFGAGAGGQERGGLLSSLEAPRNSHYRNDFRDAGGLESQSVQELEGYATYKAEETTRRAQGCVTIAEEMRDTASKTLVTVHQQGQQIHRTHMMAVDIDQDLSRSEKLLGDLGGLFSKKWKPKKNGTIKGPMLSRDDSFIRRGSHLEQRQKLGLVGQPRSDVREFHSEPTSALEKVEMEKAKQDEALSDLSDILTELKGMAVDMGSEIES
ncbi:hypothetical protein PVAP13_1NG160500 [Panicum virgatum]|uniref:t-SNARE coiled-coil homology domain-containing protein n=1 Tax=Panicum virgatum TaxID=38727 RepID=A0A8T0WT49_PANVG|nr:hypothetical protein PVAP13_1NG160500 [Panicum virgatum]